MSEETSAAYIEIMRLREQSQGLLRQVRELQARLDAQGSYAVYVVPGEKYMAAAMQDVLPDVRPGDRLRAADTGLELVRTESGMWERPGVLTFVQFAVTIPANGGRQIMPEEDARTLRPFTTSDVTWRVTVGDTGQFTAEADGFSPVTGTTYKDVADQAKIRVSQSRVKVSVPYVRLHYRGRNNSPELVRGIATGIHSSNGNLLVTEHGKSAQDTGYGMGNSTKFRPMADADSARWLELVAQLQRLENERRDLEDRYRFPDGIKQAVKDAVEAARKREAAEGGDGDDAAADGTGGSA